MRKRLFAKWLGFYLVLFLVVDYLVMLFLRAHIPAAAAGDHIDLWIEVTVLPAVACAIMFAAMRVVDAARK